MMKSLILLFAACSPDVEQPPQDEVGYDPITDECVFPLTQVDRPTLRDVLLDTDESLGCGDYIACPEGSTAVFGVESNFIEWSDFTFYGASGSVSATQPNTDGLHSDDPEDCLGAGVTTWYGTPARDCLPWSGGSRITAPSCFDAPVLDAGPAVETAGYLTNVGSLAAANDVLASQCVAVQSCPDGETLVSRVWGQYGEGPAPDYEWARRVQGAVDAFDSDGQLMGTVNLSTDTLSGVIPAACWSAPARLSDGCRVPPR